MSSLESRLDKLTEELDKIREQLDKLIETSSLMSDQARERLIYTASKLESLYDWVAMDEDGKWYAYISCPSMGRGQWGSEDTEYVRFYPGVLPMHWTKSLMEIER